MARTRARWLGAGSVVAALLTGCAHGTPAASDVPAPLRVGSVQRLTIAAHGAGAQVYECAAVGSDPTSYAWTLQGPEASLRYAEGKPLGRHYAGPTWEADDGSKVVGDVVAKAESPDPAAVPWLLLRAAQNSGTGVFAQVRFIQRLHTVGGRAPTTGCDRAYVGTRTRVDYSADYYFYSARR